MAFYIVAFLYFLFVFEWLYLYLYLYLSLSLFFSCNNQHTPLFHLQLYLPAMKISTIRKIRLRLKLKKCDYTM